MRSLQKRFDAIAMIRSIRDQLSARIAGMTLEEELEWLASQEINDPVLQHLRDKAANKAMQRTALRAAGEPLH